MYPTSGRICAKSFRCLEVCMAGRSTLVLCKYANTIAISSQMCVPVCLCPLHARDLATCTCELTRFPICHNSNCIETHLCFPYRRSCLSGNALHLGRTMCAVKFLFAVFRHQRSFFILSVHVEHPRSKKHGRDVLRCFSSCLCGSGLFRRTCELLVCLIFRSC